MGLVRTSPHGGFDGAGGLGIVARGQREGGANHRIRDGIGERGKQLVPEVALVKLRDVGKGAGVGITAGCGMPAAA